MNMNSTDYDAMHPLVAEKLNKPRSAFTPGQRLRMNVVAMFLNLFLPWGVFVFCCGISSFWMAYMHALAVKILLALIFIGWFTTAVLAIIARFRDPDPTWYTYLCIVVGLAALFGTSSGQSNFTAFSEPYFKLHDLKTVSGIDPTATPGENVMDAGVIHFAPGTHMDGLKTWHFMYKRMYCVAPLVNNGSTPLGLNYDYWIVGKDCCAMAASDFRCGAWGSLQAQGGYRVINEGDLTFYRLAVQQAESLYDIRASNPVFLVWSANPSAAIEGWNQQAFQSYLLQVGFAFVFCFFFMAMASCRFAWVGRGAQTPVTWSDPEWMYGSAPGGYGPRGSFFA